MIGTMALSTYFMKWIGMGYQYEVMEFGAILPTFMGISIYLVSSYLLNMSEIQVVIEKIYSKSKLFMRSI